MDALQDQVGEKTKATLNESILRVDVEIGLNGELTHGWWEREPPSIQYKPMSETTYMKLGEVPKQHEKSRHKR